MGSAGSCTPNDYQHFKLFIQKLLMLANFSHSL